MKKKKLHLKRKNYPLLLIILLSLSLTIYGFVRIIFWVLDNYHNQEEINDLKEKVLITDQKTKEDEKVIEEDNISSFDPYWDFIKMDYMEVDFSDLEKENQEVVAWVFVNGTNINYPVVKHSDNEYYLNHSFYGSKNEAGWVFMDYRNQIRDFDKNTILYAHGRKNGSMFGSLKNILKSNWYQNSNNYVIKLSTKYENSLWQVFSVYHIPTTSDYIQVHFSDQYQFSSFLELISKRSYYDFQTGVRETDKVLTLSTCFNDHEKVVMHAKLIKVQKR